MTHNSPEAYRSSAQYYSISNSHEKENPTSNLKIANAYFLANDLDKAISKYKDIVEDTHSKARETKEAYYQLVVTYEKKWRMITSGEMSGKPTKTLNKLKTYTLGYSNKYPNSTNHKELLHLLANTYQDNQEFDKSMKIWNRILLSKPSVNLRSTAIRGIVLSNLKLSDNKTVVNKIEKLLDLEDWKTLPKSLKLELLGLLGEYVIKVADTLNDKTNERADYLYSKIHKYNQLPDHRGLWLKTTYAYADIHQWKRALSCTEEYLKSYGKKDNGNMTYLMAKANDYLLDFDKAQKNYFDFSKKFPNHPKAEIALERAVDLAEFNDQIDKATKLALEASVHTKDKNKKEKLSNKKQRISRQNKDYINQLLKILEKHLC